MSEMEPNSEILSDSLKKLIEQYGIDAVRSEFETIAANQETTENLAVNDKNESVTDLELPPNITTLDEFFTTTEIIKPYLSEGNISHLDEFISLVTDIYYKRPRLSIKANILNILLIPFSDDKRDIKSRSAVRWLNINRVLVIKLIEPQLKSDGYEIVNLDSSVPMAFNPSIHQSIGPHPVNDPALKGLVMEVARPGLKKEGFLEQPVFVRVGRYENTE